VKDVNENDRIAVADIFVDLVGQTLECGRRPETMSSFMGQLMKTMRVWIDEESVLERFKRGNVLLEDISSWLQPKIDEDILIAMLHIISKLTKGISIKPRSVYVTKLIRFGFLHMLKSGEHTESFLGYVKVLINVCSANSGCYLTARGDPLFKNLWKKMSNFMINTKELGKEQVTYAEFRVPLLLFHLMYILESGPNSQILLWGMRNGQAYAEKCFEFCIDNPNHKIAATALDDLSGFFSTLFSQVRHQMAVCETDEGVLPSDLGIATAFVEETKELENKTVALSQTVLHLLKQKMEVKDFYCEYLDRVISLCSVLIPDFIPSMEIQGTCRVSLK
jgi:hypothetical protein